MKLALPVIQPDSLSAPQGRKPAWLKVRAPGGANYFNLTVGASDLTVTALECNFPNAGTSGVLNMYIIPGASYVDVA